MSENDDFDEVLETIKNMVQTLDDNIHSELKDDNDNVIGYVCTRRNQEYQIYSQPESEYFIVSASYSFIQEFSRKITLEDKDLDSQNEVIEENKELEDSDINVDLGLKELDRWVYENQETYDRMLSELIIILSSPECSFLIEQRNNLLLGFQLKRKIFPYHNNGISIENLDKSIRTVINVKTPASELLRDIFNLRDIEIDNKKDSSQFRYFN